MKKYLLCFVLLFLSAVSFRTAGAKECSGTAGGYSFDYSTGALTFDDDCTSIDGFGRFSAFDYATNIKTVDLSNTSVTTIRDDAFWYCSSLTSISFPTSLTSIGDSAFSWCTSLTSVHFPNSVTSIGDFAFSSCTSLTSVNFPDSLTYLGDHAFQDCSLTSVDLSNTSLTFFEGAFHHCTFLTSVTLPASLTSIGVIAFEGCSHLVSIDLSNTSLTSIGRSAFSNLADPSTITVTYGSKAHELLGENGLDSVTGDKVKKDYTYSFYPAGEIYEVGHGNTTLIIIDSPTPQPGTASVVEEIRVVPLPEDEYGSYELDPVTGEKTYLLFHTYDICMNFLNSDALCSGYEHCYHK